MRLFQETLVGGERCLILSNARLHSISFDCIHVWFGEMAPPEFTRLQSGTLEFLLEQSVFQILQGEAYFFLEDIFLGQGEFAGMRCSFKELKQASGIFRVHLRRIESVKELSRILEKNYEYKQ